MSFQLKTYMASVREHLDQALRDFLPHSESDDYLNLFRAMADSLLDGGKRLRPCLTIAACEAVGGTLQQALPAACSLEMIHAYSLVHDDLPSMDDDDMRRGNPTCHKKYGEAAAILAGDALLTLAFEVLAKDGTDGTGSPKSRIRACLELARAAGANGMVGGQAMDMALKGSVPGFDTLEQCHLQKTAALFAGAAAIGALVGEAPEETVSTLRRFGQTLGLAFQHADDLRDSDYPDYVRTSLERCLELTREAATIATQFGQKGLPLVEMTKLVECRAKEVIPNETAISN